jgi:hypothetical protein
MSNTPYLVTYSCSLTKEQTSVFQEGIDEDLAKEYTRTTKEGGILPLTYGVAGEPLLQICEVESIKLSRNEDSKRADLDITLVIRSPDEYDIRNNKTPVFVLTDIAVYAFYANVPGNFLIDTARVAKDGWAEWQKTWRLKKIDLFMHAPTFTTKM